MSGVVAACREFTINLISEWFVEAAHHTCGNYDRGVDEVELSGLTPVPSVNVWLAIPAICTGTVQ